MHTKTFFFLLLFVWANVSHATIVIGSGQWRLLSDPYREVRAQTAVYACNLAISVQVDLRKDSIYPITNVRNTSITWNGSTVICSREEYVEPLGGWANRLITKQMTCYGSVESCNYPNNGAGYSVEPFSYSPLPNPYAQTEICWDGIERSIDTCPALACLDGSTEVDGICPIEGWSRLMIGLPADTTFPPLTDAGGYPSHQGNSPWRFDKNGTEPPSGTYIVNDTDSSLIDKYRFRSAGPIIIEVPNYRYVGPTDASGHLLNVDELTSRGIVSATASITIPVFDVDQDTFPVFDCDGDEIPDQLNNEVTQVFFNDKLLGALRGANGTWKRNFFDDVPITEIKFPSQPGEVAINHIRIDVDVANEGVVLSSGIVGCDVWSTEIDWVGLKFKAASPVVFVHGIRSQGTVFSNMKTGFDSNFVTSNLSINLVDTPKPDPLPPGCPDIPYNNSISNNVAQLQTKIPAIAEQYGTSSINLVTHSKGGLDSRVFLHNTNQIPISVTVGTMGGQPVRKNLTANSLVTLDTPHRGSILADFGVAARHAATTTDLTGTGALFAAAASILEGSYYCDLTTVWASAFVAASELPNGVQTASVAADANRDGDLGHQISSTEAAGFPGGSTAATLLYKIVGDVDLVNVTVTTRPGLPDLVEVTSVEDNVFKPNDLIVTQDSAALYPTYPNIDGWHHLNVHSEVNGEAIAQDAQSSGMVNWRIK